MAWTSGEAWFDALMDALATPEGEAVRARGKVAAKTLLRIAREEWMVADVAAGRDVATSHATVGRKVDRCERQVGRARRVLALLGFAVTIEGGRYLHSHERAAARDAHGGHQVRAASTRALTLPRPASVENVQLPPKGLALKESPVKESLPTRASAHEASASRPRARTSTTGRSRQDASRSPRPIELQRFAGQLVARMPWLARGRHVGAVCSMLGRVGVDPARWTVDALLDAIARANVASGTVVPAAVAQRDPLGYLAWSIGRAIDPAEPTPTEVAREVSEQRRAERARRAQERAAQPPQAPDELARIAQIIEQMKVDEAARRRAQNRPAPHPERLRSGTARKDQPMAQSTTARITQALLGAGGRRHMFEPYVHERLDFALRLNGLLTWRGWTLDPDLVDVELISWTWGPSTDDGVPDDHERATIVTLNVDTMTMDVTRVAEHADKLERLDWAGLEAALEGLEAFRSTTAPE
ncbi:MAG: hypothetical protein ABI632_01940 [Pseudolysinimonas sp.]